MRSSTPSFPDQSSSTDRHAVFICSAYKDPELVHRLVRSLQHDRIDVFMHVDSAVDVEPFLHPGARQVPFRLRTGWASFAMTEGILRWLRLTAPEGYRTFTHITGQCYPVLSPEELVAELDRMDVPMFAMNRRPEDHTWRYRFFHVPAKLGLRGFRDRLLKKFWFRERAVRQLPRGLRWGVGCAMWSLDRPSVDWMLEFLSGRPDIEEFFRNVFASDETFFATLLASSPWSESLGGPTHYIDWSAGGKHPKDLEISDLPRIIESGRWFVRKVLPGTSDTLLDRIDEWKRLRANGAVPSLRKHILERKDLIKAH